jgi:DNA repair exonuclease SbcCD ATPase subunit
MKIKSITLKNFQSHKLSKVELDKGVTALIGENDQGKSSVLRGLYWLTFNRPLGDDFRSNWGGDTSVEVITDDGSIIKRVKTDSKNQYWLNDEVFEGFGTNVPEPIQKALNLSELNFSTPREAPFLIHSEAGEVGKFFNKAINLEIIDRAQSHAGLRTKRIRREMVFTQEALKEKEEELKELSWVRKAEGEVNALVNRGNALDRQIKILSYLKNAGDELSVINERCADLTKYARLSEKVGRIWGRWAALEERENKLVELRKLSRALGELREGIEENEKILETESEVNKLDRKFWTLGKRRKALNEIKSNQTVLKKIDILMKETQNTKKTFETEFHRLMPNICPLCGHDSGGTS